MSTTTTFTRLATLAVLAMIFSASLSSVGSKSAMTGGSLVEGDVLSYKMSDLADLSNVQVPITTRGDQSRPIHDDMAFTTQPTENGTIEYAKQLTDELVVLIRNRADIEVIQLGGLGKSFVKGGSTTYQWTDFGFVECTDVVYNQPRNMLYVGCITRNTQPGASNSIMIKTINLEDGSSSITTTNQDDGFVMKNRLQLFITTIPLPSGGSDVYLIAYDEGNSSSATLDGSNMYVRYWRNVVDRTLTYFDKATVNSKSGLAGIYDFYHFNTGLVATGRATADSTFIQTANCTLDPYGRTLTCGGL